MIEIRKFFDVISKKNNEIFLVDKYIFRKLSPVFSFLFVLLGFSANAVTFLSFVSILICCVFYYLGNYFLGGLFFLLYLILDVSDGEVARYHGKSNGQSGFYLDLLVHYYSTNLVFIIIGFQLYSTQQSVIIVLTSIICCFGASNFPNLVANYVLVKIISSNGINNSLDEYLRIQEGNEDAKDILLNLNMKKVIFKILKELVVYPGAKIGIILISMTSFIFKDIHFVMMYLLVFYSIIYIFLVIRKILYHIASMRDVK